MVKQKVFKIYSDSENSWIAVKNKELVELGLQNQFSQFSYIHGASSYLDTLADLPKFKTAYEAKYGPLQTVTIDHGARSWVRNYTPYVNLVTVETVNGFMKENVGESDQMPILTAKDLAPSAEEMRTKLLNEVEGITLNLPDIAVNLKSDF